MKKPTSKSYLNFLFIGCIKKSDIILFIPMLFYTIRKMIKMNEEEDKEKEYPKYDMKYVYDDHTNIEPSEGALDPYQNWNQSRQNPFVVILASGTANLSSNFVVSKHPEVWDEFKEWNKKEKKCEPKGKINERVVLLYSGETEGFKEKVANYIATNHNLYVLTAPNLFIKETGEKIAFGAYPKENMNDFIKRMIHNSHFAVILYTEQGGQIIETSWCSDTLKPTLGLVQFYRGSLNNKNKECCKFLKQDGELFFCSCKRGQAYRGNVGAWICADEKTFCPFVEQKLTKMIFDFYIVNPQMYLYGAVDRKTLLKPIDNFLSSN